MDFGWIRLQSARAKIMAIILAAIIILGVCIFFLVRPFFSAGIPIEDISLGGFFSPTLVIAAEKDSAFGIELDSGFVISSGEAISVAEVQKYLGIQPQVEYKLQQHGSKEVLLKPVAFLESDTVYNILLAENSYEPPLSWAFQTRNSFRVSSTFPADEARYVPVNSGIELHFSQPVANIDQFVGISPQINGKLSQFDQKTIFQKKSTVLAAGKNIIIGK